MIFKFILKTSRDIDLVHFYSKNARGTSKMKGTASVFFGFLHYVSVRIKRQRVDFGVSYFLTGTTTISYWYSAGEGDASFFSIC